jgi:hypothetical protein
MRSFTTLAIVLSGSAALVIFRPAALQSGASAAIHFGSPLAGCDVKGNISYGTGERTYLPGQKHYFGTRINLSKGQQWFCSEAEALAAGCAKRASSQKFARLRPQPSKSRTLPSENT